MIELRNRIGNVVKIYGDIVEQEAIDQIALCEELAKEEGCFDAPEPFPVRTLTLPGIS